MFERLSPVKGLKSAPFLADMSCVMKTGGHHARTQRLYAGGWWCTSRGGGMGVDFCWGRSSGAAAEAGAGLARAHRRDGEPLAGGGQERGWGAGVAVAGGVVRACVSLNVAQGVSRAADGGVPERERSGTTLSGTAGRPGATDPRSRFDRTRRGSLRSGGQEGGQR